MSKANQSLRDELTEKRITFWQLADCVNVHESTIIRWMRTALTQEREALIRSAIEEILAKRKVGGGHAL